MRNHFDNNGRPACGAWSCSIRDDGKTVKVVKGIIFVDCNSCKKTNIYKNKIKRMNGARKNQQYT